MGSINIQATSEESKFETWLGAIIEPGEKFSLVINAPEDLETVLHRVAKIGYEKQLQSILTLSGDNLVQMKPLDVQDLKKNPGNYTIIDVRNKSEVAEGRFFGNAQSHPLNTLRDTSDEIPTDRPIVVHCAGGYRSAAGSSILAKQLNPVTVYDLGEAVKEFE